MRPVNHKVERKNEGRKRGSSSGKKGKQSHHHKLDHMFCQGFFMSEYWLPPFFLLSNFFSMASHCSASSGCCCRIAGESQSTVKCRMRTLQRRVLIEGNRKRCVCIHLILSRTSLQLGLNSSTHPKRNLRATNRIVKYYTDTHADITKKNKGSPKFTSTVIMAHFFFTYVFKQNHIRMIRKINLTLWKRQQHFVSLQPKHDFRCSPFHVCAVCCCCFFLPKAGAHMNGA